VLDRLEAAKEFAEDPTRQVAGGDLAEEERRREYDDESPAHPEGE
jgi:hypothetical protein